MCGETASGSLPAGFVQQKRAVSLCWKGWERLRRDEPKGIREAELKRDVQENKSLFCQYPHPCVLFEKKSGKIQCCKVIQMDWFLPHKHKHAYAPLSKDTASVPSRARVHSEVYFIDRSAQGWYSNTAGKANQTWLCIFMMLWNSLSLMQTLNPENPKMIRIIDWQTSVIKKSMNSWSFLMWTWMIFSKISCLSIFVMLWNSLSNITMFFQKTFRMDFSATLWEVIFPIQTEHYFFNS